MDNTTAEDEILEAARFAAWQRMRAETRALLHGTGGPTLSHDLPHVAAWLAARAHFVVELERYGRGPDGRAVAHRIMIDAEAAYVAAILPEELERAGAGSAMPIEQTI